MVAVALEVGVSAVAARRQLERYNGTLRLDRAERPSWHAFALKELTAVEETRIDALVKKAVS
jgi:hypothetical protein